MDMAMKEKLLLIWVLAAVAISFFLSSSWAWAAYAIEKAVALGLISWPVVALLAAGSCGANFLP
jgi:hypothetical protein